MCLLYFIIIVKCSLIENVDLPQRASPKMSSNSGLFSHRLCYIETGRCCRLGFRCFIKAAY